MRRWLPVVALAALISAASASAVGPWPGLARGVTTADGTRFTATRADGSTTVRAIRGGQVVATVKVAGGYGIPAVTSVGTPGGLSPDGKMLFLTEPPSYSDLRTQSRFVVLDTRPLAVRETVVLPGDFGFDAVSPDRRTLYVIQHTSTAPAYKVRAYDLRTRRLVPRVIVAKGEAGAMRGYPVARAASKSGAWVYTLYTRQTGKPFVHALDAAHRLAVCIDLPWKGTFGDALQAHVALSADGSTLRVLSHGRSVATIDTKTFAVH